MDSIHPDNHTPTKKRGGERIKKKVSKYVKKGDPKRHRPIASTRVFPESSALDPTVTAVEASITNPVFNPLVTVCSPLKKLKQQKKEKVRVLHDKVRYQQ